MQAASLLKKSQREGGPERVEEIQKAIGCFLQLQPTPEGPRGAVPHDCQSGGCDCYDLSSHLEHGVKEHAQRAIQWSQAPVWPSTPGSSCGSACLSRALRGWGWPANNRSHHLHPQLPYLHRCYTREHFPLSSRDPRQRESAMSSTQNLTAQQSHNQQRQNLAAFWGFGFSAIPVITSDSSTVLQEFYDHFL